MKWLEVVKKHLKLNPGKSLKDVMPEVKKEYYALKGTPKKSVHKKTHHKKTHHKKSKKARKSRKRRR
tara:strand:- start:424 stop:624 length:201 start_codon:yes stop_codon:yes gene_type:complete